MESFQELKKWSVQKETEKGRSMYKLAVMGDCATQHLVVALRGKFNKEGLHVEILDLDYNQITAQILDLESELYRFQPNAVLIQMCTEKLYENYLKLAPTERKEFAQEMVQKIVFDWGKLYERRQMTVLQFNFPEFDDGIHGNFAAQYEMSFIFQLRKLNVLLSQEAATKKFAHIVDICGVQAKLGRDFFHSDKLYYLAKMPVNLPAIPYVANEVFHVVRALQGRTKKCVVVDLDNTLWGGVIGDDGLCGIQVGELGQGRAFSELQSWLLELKMRGILLAVCSKNDEETAKQPFLHHPEMRLKLKDFAIFIANWKNKDENIAYICDTLNIGRDSVVFLDDNPFERGLVRQMLPDVTVPELPEDPADYLGSIRTLGLFETVSVSVEDAMRTKQYQAEANRQIAKAEFDSFEDYLCSLEMRAEVSAFTPFQFARIAQLTQRSNQFNLRTVRYTEADIERIAQDDQFITRYFSLEDKFGDHGLIAVLIMEKCDANTAFVDTWLMSCRVLKRTMEAFVVNEMVQAAKAAGVERIIGEYIPTLKNRMVADLYKLYGFKEMKEDKNRFVLRLQDYDLQNTFIKRKDA